MSSVQEIILLFTKYPESGKSKTRLIPLLGPAGAANLQRKMTLDITAKVVSFCKNNSCHSEIYYEGGHLDLMEKWLGPLHTYQKQSDGDIGKRMNSAITEKLPGYDSIVLIGADCPAIDEKIFHEAFSALTGHDIVIGPAYDGGYYLIGVNSKLGQKTISSLFRNITWGESEVLEQTLLNIDSVGHKYHLLKQLHDIDTPEDLQHLNNHSNA